MPVTRSYTGGSIVYFQGDMGDDIFVLHQGRVVLTSNEPGSNDEIKEEVQAGEFFGIRSSLGRYPREETAQVVGKTILIQFSSTEFEQFAIKNTRLVMKMLRVFSKQLRNIHRRVRDLLKAGVVHDPAYELMNVAESFYRSGNNEHAVYAFGRYLELYPGGVYGGRAKELMDMAKDGQVFPHGYPALEVVQGSPVDAFPMNLGGNPGGGGHDGQIRNQFYEGLDAFGKKDYSSAIHHWESCASASLSSNHPDFEFVSRARFEIGRAHFHLGEVTAARGSFTDYLKSYPTGDHLKDSIFHLGLIAEKEGDKTRAKALYAKVVTLPPNESLNQEARKRIEGL